MFRAFIDDSGKGDERLFVLAGYIATAAKWAQFSDEWRRLLDTQSTHYRKLEYFKMSDMRSERDRERCGHFYGIIEKYVHVAVSCVIDVRGLVNAVDSFKWPSYLTNVEKLKNPYYFAFKAITNMAAQHQAKFDIHTPIDFIFDEEMGEKGRCVDGWDRLKHAVTPEVLAVMGNTPAFMDDKTTPPL